MTRMSAAVLATLVCLQTALGATSYPPVTFADLTARADIIFLGEVIEVRPFALQTREGTIVKTRVTFRVTDPIFGTRSSIELLEFFGGEMNGVGMAIGGMPRFAEGDRRVVFAHRERSVNPIVGFTQGLLRVARDAAGVDRVTTLDGRLVAQTDNIGDAATRAPAGAQAMTAADLGTRIRAAVAGRRP